MIAHLNILHDFKKEFISQKHSSCAFQRKQDPVCGNLWIQMRDWLINSGSGASFNEETINTNCYNHYFVYPDTLHVFWYFLKLWSSFITLLFFVFYKSFICPFLVSLHLDPPTKHHNTDNAEWTPWLHGEWRNFYNRLKSCCFFLSSSECSTDIIKLNSRWVIVCLYNNGWDPVGSLKLMLFPSCTSSAGWCTTDDGGMMMWMCYFCISLDSFSSNSSACSHNFLVSLE